MIGFLPSVGPTEFFIIIGVLVLLFGVRKVPEAARSVGQTLGELRHAAKDEPDDPGSGAA